MSVVICLPLIFCFVLANGCTYDCIRKIRKVALIIILFCVGSYFLNEYKYGSTDTWKGCLERLNYRLVDYAEIDYEKNEDVLKKMGISENDLDCYYNWIFADFQVFSIDTLKMIDRLNTFRNKYEVNVISLMLMMFGLEANKYFGIVMISVSLVLLFNVGKKYFFVLGTIMISYGGILGLFIRKRMVNNAMYMVFLSGFLAVLGICCIINWEERKKQKKRWGIANILDFLFVITLISYTLLLSNRRYQSYVYAYEGSESIIKEIEAWEKENPDILIVGTVSVLNTFYNMPIWQDHSELSFDKRVKLGTWDMGSQRWYDQCEGFDVDPERLIIELACNSNVRLLIEGKRDLIMVSKFITEHTGTEVFCELERQFDESGWLLYKLSI